MTAAASSPISSASRSPAGASTRSRPPPRACSGGSAPPSCQPRPGNHEPPGRRARRGWRSDRVRLVMSRIGRKPIELPAGVMVAISPGRVQVNGPLGELSQTVPTRMQIEKTDAEVVVTRLTERGEDRALHGLTRTLIANMVEGVTKGFEKHPEIQGVGQLGAAQGHRPRARRRVLAFHCRQAARRDHVRRPDADAGRRQGHRQADGRPGQAAGKSARCARPSRTRARRTCYANEQVRRKVGKRA